MTRLTPTASPVDIFSRPGTRQDSSAGSSLTQLARSLSSLEPKLSKLAGQYDESEKNRQIAEAIEFQRSNQLQNMEQIGEAVKRGELDENENPWKLTTVKQLVAQQQFRAHSLKVEQEILEDPELRDSDDFESLQAELSTRLSEPFGDVDGFTLRALQPETQRFIDGFMNQHRTRRLGERELEAMDAFSAGIREVVSGPAAALRALKGSDDPEVAALSRGVMQRAQAHLDAYSRTTSKSKVTRVALVAVEQAGVSAQDWETAEHMLNTLTVEGKPLRESVDGSYIKELKQKITRAKLDEFRLVKAVEAQRDELMTREAYAQLEQIQAEGGNALTGEVDLAGLSPTARMRVQAFMQKMSELSAEQSFTKASSKLFAGNLTKEDKASFMVTAIALGYAGDEAIQKFKRLEKMQATPTWGENTPDTYRVLTNLRIRNASFDESVSVLETMVEAGMIDEETFSTNLEAAFSRATPAGQQRDKQTRAALEVAQNNMRAGLSADANLVDIDGNLDPIAEARMASEIGTMGVMLDNLFRNVPPDMPAAELQKAIDYIIDTGSRKVGGYTIQKMQDEFDLISVRNELSQAGVLTGYKGKLKFSDGNFIAIGRDGTEGNLLSTPTFFTGPDAVQAELQSVVETLGVRSLEDVERFLTHQKSAYPQNNRKLLKAIDEELRILQTYIEENKPDGRPLPDTEAFEEN